MSRIDKYDPIAGGFRAPLAQAYNGSNGNPVGVGLDINGRVVVGGGVTGIVGVICIPPLNLNVPSFVKAAGSQVDVMTHGELVEFTGVAGTKYYAGADGVISTTATGVLVGWTVEANRLIVRVKPA